MSPEPGWPNPALQLSGVALAALAALLAGGITWRLSVHWGLSPSSGALAALVAGLSVAWQPFLVRASVHLWAEPLGLCLSLGALAAALAPRGAARTCALALCLGLARHARPEAWVLAPVVLGWLARREGLRAVLAPAGGVLLLELSLWGLTGSLAPQLELLLVSDYQALMEPGARAAAERGVAAGIGRNFLSQLEAALLPKNAALIVPLALLSLRQSAPRLPQLLAGALALATLVVWSTDDASRFTIAPLCLFAIPASLEGLRLAQGLARARRRPALALGLALWLGVLGHAGGRSMRGRSGSAPELSSLRPQPGTPSLRDPWSYALATGRPARLSQAPPE